MSLSREEITLLTDYEREQSEIRQQLVGGLYWNCLQMLKRYAIFQADLQPDGRFATLAEQFMADSAESITPDEINELVTAMQAIVSVMEIVEARTPGIFGIPIQGKENV